MDVEKNWATIKRGEVYRGLRSRPEEWKFFGAVKYEPSACQLCDTPILWRYALQRAGTSEVLWVGSECIHEHYQAWMPNGLQMALEMLKKATKKVKQGLVAQKMEEFKKGGNEDVVDYLLGPERRGYRDGRILCDVAEEGGPGGKIVMSEWVRVSKFRASIRRKGYLKPEELASFLTGYGVSRWGKPYADSKIQETGVQA